MDRVTGGVRESLQIDHVIHFFEEGGLVVDSRKPVGDRIGQSCADIRTAPQLVTLGEVWFECRRLCILTLDGSHFQ